MIYDPLNKPINTQFELSYELLHFLRWLLLEQKDEHKTLKAVIQRALHAGLKNTTSSSRKKFDAKQIQGLQYDLIEFFALLDTLLYEVMHEEIFQKTVQKKLTSTIQQIDVTLCDNATLYNTIEKTAYEIERSPEKNAKTILCETLLKQWHPLKKNESH